MKSRYFVCLLAWVVVVLGGCNKGSVSAGALDTTAFQSAAPEVKAAWDGIVGAMRSNDYVTVFFALRQLRGHEGLTPQQIAAVDAQSTALNDRMATEAEKGDTNALQAIQEIRKLSRMR